MSESFQIIFNSQGSNVLSNTNRNAVRYDVNWGAFLPKRYKKFKVEFIFKSANFAGGLSDNGFVNMNLGRMNIYNGNSMSYNMGIIYPVWCNAVSFYNASISDNNDIWMDYPTNNIVTISLLNFAGNNIGNMPHYCLMLNLIGIKDDDIPK